ncbi:MAG: EthD domain-containing protein [Burkholderiales bacterium]|nr:EthD domain-containing protein [Burkholderiales bacterium]
MSTRNPMVKIIRMVRRREGMTLAQLRDYWMTRHAELHRRALDMCPVKRVVASFATGEVVLGGAQAQFDAMTTLYFDSMDDLKSARSGPVPQMMAEDERNFAGEVPVRIVAEEYLMSRKSDAGDIPKACGQLKIIRTVYRRRDLTHAQFRDYWLNNHSRLEDRVVKESPTQHIVASFAVPEPGREPDMDGMVELYYRSAQDIRAMFAGPVPQMMREDERNFVQMDAPAIRAVAEEYLIAGG